MLKVIKADQRMGGRPYLLPFADEQPAEGNWMRMTKSRLQRRRGKKPPRKTGQTISNECGICLVLLQVAFQALIEKVLPTC